MAVVTIRRNGFSASEPGPGRTPGDDGASRGEIVGWTEGAARRNTGWLQSVDGDSLDFGQGVALTLTMGAWPSGPDRFHAARHDFLRRAARAGWTLHHWVVESTALGRPHIHLALFGVESSAQARWLLVCQWLAICDREGWPVEARAQTAEPITRLTGWLEYVSKHGARGVRHYQRSTPFEGWDRTGRLWGHSKGWPTPEPMVYDLTEAEFHRFRRLAVALVRSRLRAAGMSSTARQRAGSQLRSPDPRKSRRAGIGYWLDRDAADAIVSLSIGREPVIRYHDWE